MLEVKNKKSYAMQEEFTYNFSVLLLKANAVSYRLARGFLLGLLYWDVI